MKTLYDTDLAKLGTVLSFDEPVEFIGPFQARRIEALYVNARFQHNVAVTFTHADGLTIGALYVQDPRFVDDSGGESHGVLVNQTKFLVITTLVSLCTKPYEMEDHLNFTASAGCVVQTLVAIGKVRKSGSALCIDRGSTGCTVGTVISNDGGLTVAEGRSHHIGNPLVVGTRDQVVVRNDLYGDGTNYAISVELQNARHLKRRNIQKNPKVKVIWS